MEASVQPPVYELNLRKDPLIPFRVHRCIQATGRRPQNWHENIEFLYCISGEGFVTYNDRRIPIREGQLVVVNSEMFHSVISDTHMDYHCLTLDRHFCRESGIPTTQLYFQELIDDPQELREIAQRGYECGKKYHNKKSNDEMLRKDLFNI